ncbi:MAG: VOC family protein [Bacteroidota bacterium]|nr:VOC family protein [Bacteroidota bacterium]
MTLIPYVHFEGNAEEALNFYKNILDGEIVMVSRYGDAPMPVDEDWKNKLMHARLKFGNSILYVSDGPKDYKVNRGQDIQLSVDVPDESKIEEIFNKMAEGGKVTMPLADQFWGAKFGMLHDKFGIGWMFNCEKKK